MNPKLQHDSIHNSTNPNVDRIAKLFSQKKYKAKKARAALAEAARNGDMEALENFSLFADENRDLVGKSQRFYTLSYFYEQLNRTEKTPGSFYVPAEEFHDVAQIYDCVASATSQYCRALARYDAEEAKILFYDLVDDFARSDSEARQAYAERFCRSKNLVRPLAASDARFDESLLAFPDDLDATSRRALRIKLTLMRNAYQLVNPNPDEELVRKINVAIRKLVEESAIHDDKIAAENVKDVKQLLKVAKKPKTIKRSIDNLKTQNPTLYFKNESKIVNFYLEKVFESALYSDEFDALKRKYVQACVDELTVAKNKPTLAREIARTIWTLTSVDEDAENVLIDFANALKTVGNAELEQCAEMFDGLERYRTLVGEEPVLEGVTIDGKEFELNKYLGKKILVLLDSVENRQIPQYIDLIGGDILVVEYLIDTDEFAENYEYPEDDEEEDFSREDFEKRGYVKEKDRVIISRSRSLAKTKNSRKTYRDVALYYGSILNAVPNQSFLIDVDGTVESVGTNNQTDIVDECDGELDDEDLFDEDEEDEE